MFLLCTEVFWYWCVQLSACRISADGGIVIPRSGSQFTLEESEDLNVELERPALDAVISKDELHRLKKDEKKRQEVINGTPYLLANCY